MKKFILSMAIAAVALVGCDVKDNTPTVFQYDNYVYVVDLSENSKPADLLAFEITYTDKDGVKKTETVTKSWSYTVPAKKGFNMELSAKQVLPAGKVVPTTGGELKYDVNVYIGGVETDGKYKVVTIVKRYSLTLSKDIEYKAFKAGLAGAKVESAAYVIQPILEPGM